MRINKGFIFGGCILFVGQSFVQNFQFAHALETDEALMIVSDQATEHIPELHWEGQIVKVTYKEEGFIIRPTVELGGRFQKKNWNLVFGNQQILIDLKTGQFNLSLPLQARTTEVKLSCVGPMGDIQVEKLVIVFDSWDTFVKNLNTTSNPDSTTGIFTGLGITSASYRRTNTNALSSNLLTLKTSYQSNIKQSRWTLGANLFLTVLPITNSRSDVTVRYFGMNARVGYALPWITNPWSISLLGGYYYTTMFVSGESIGYHNIMGPIFYPVLSRKISSTDSISIFAKMSPISDGLAVLALSNRELAWGLAWIHQLKNGHPLLLEFVTANFSLTIGKIAITNSTYSLGTSYAW